MDDRILFHLSKSGNKLKTYLQGQFRENNVKISPAQMGILFLLKLNNSQPMSDLSRVLEIDNSAITRLVDRLEKLNFVTREHNPEDRRQYLIKITAQGLKEINRAKSIVRDTNNRIKEGFSDKEIEIFLRVIHSIYDRFDV